MKTIPLHLAGLTLLLAACVQVVPEENPLEPWDEPFDFLQSDYGELYDFENGIEYGFWWYRAAARDPRPSITIHKTEGEGRGLKVVYPDFRPTAMSYPDGDRGRLIVAGLPKEGPPVLVEYRFQYTPEFQVLVDAEPFGDVSTLQTISATRIVEGMEPLTVQVLDGRSGQFGYVRKGETFQPQLGPEHVDALRGMLSIWESHLESDTVWPRLNLWPLPPHTCSNPEDGAMLILDPPTEADGTRYADTVRFL